MAKKIIILLVPFMIITLLITITSDTRNFESSHITIAHQQLVDRDFNLNVDVIETNTADSEGNTAFNIGLPYDAVSYSIKVANTGNLVENITVNYYIITMVEGQYNHTVYKTLKSNFVIDQLDQGEVYEKLLDEIQWVLVSDIVITSIIVKDNDISPKWH